MSTVCLSIRLLMDILVTWLVMPQNMHIHACVWVSVFNFFGTYLGLELHGHMAILHLTFFLSSFLPFFVFLGLLAYGSNQSCSCWTTPQPQQHKIGAMSATYTTACGNTVSYNSPSEARDPTHILMVTSQGLSLLTHSGNSCLTLRIHRTVFHSSWNILLFYQ